MNIRDANGNQRSALSSKFRRYEAEQRALARGDAHVCISQSIIGLRGYICQPQNSAKNAAIMGLTAVLPRW
jgi:hypothetical protein